MQTKNGFVLIAHKLLYICVFFLAIICFGCDDSVEKTSDQRTGTGAIAFSVRWGESPGEESTTEARSMTDCGDVSDVEAYVYDVQGNELGYGGPWSCSDHEGTVSDVSAGSGRKVVVLGLNADDYILYRGEKTNVNVVAGDTIHSGSISAPSFSSSISSPNDYATVTIGETVFSWSSVSGATMYRFIVWDTNSDDQVIRVHIEGTSYTPSTQELDTNTDYAWNVAAIDQSDTVGLFADVRYFSTSGATAICTDVDGDWDITINVDPSDCDESPYSYDAIAEITQNGCSLAVTIDGKDFIGTINDNSISLNGSYPEDPGTTEENIYLTVSGDSVSGTSSWEYVEPGWSCSGSNTISGTRADGGSGGSDLPTPTNFHVASGDGRAKLYWHSPVDISLWTLYWSTSSSVSTSFYQGRELLEITAERTDDLVYYNHTPLTNNTMYYYIIASRNDLNEESTPSSPAISAYPGTPGSNQSTDDFESNNSFGTAWDNAGDPSGWESTWLTNLGDTFPFVSASDEEDWFKIETTGTETRLFVDCYFTHANGDIDLYLYDAGGNAIDSVSAETSDDNESIDYTGSSPSVYYIQVLFYPTAGSNDYDLIWGSSVP